MRAGDADLRTDRPILEHILVLCLEGGAAVDDVAVPLRGSGGTVVQTDIPYWDDDLTVADPTSYRLVLRTCARGRAAPLRRWA